MMSPGRGVWDWLATCHCGEDGGSGRGHDVISLSSSHTPAVVPKVVSLLGGGGGGGWEVCPTVAVGNRLLESRN